MINFRELNSENIEFNQIFDSFLSKRNSVTSLQDYFDKGYLQSSMINMLARLGWSKGEKEIFYLDDLIKDFRMQEVQKAGAIFDQARYLKFRLLVFLLFE